MPKNEIVSVPEIVDQITKVWLRDRARIDLDDEAEQARMRARLLSFVGKVDLGSPKLSENTGAEVRRLLVEKAASRPGPEEPQK